MPTQLLCTPGCRSWGWSVWGQVEMNFCYFYFPVWKLNAVTAARWGCLQLSILAVNSACTSAAKKQIFRGGRRCSQGWWISAHTEIRKGYKWSLTRVLVGKTCRECFTLGGQSLLMCISVEHPEAEESPVLNS